jgi:hypothetical protein
MTDTEALNLVLTMATLWQDGKVDRARMFAPGFADDGLDETAEALRIARHVVAGMEAGR